MYNNVLLKMLENGIASKEFCIEAFDRVNK